MAIVGEGGVQIGNTIVSTDALWAYLASAAALFVFLFAPILGTISDFSSSKKKFLITFAYIGSISAQHSSTSLNLEMYGGPLSYL